MDYVSSRGGQAVSGLEAVWRGLSREGGLFVPQAPPPALDLQSLVGLSPEGQMAEFFYRFLPCLSREEWTRLLDGVLEDLKGGRDRFELPLTPINRYLDRYYLLTADGMPTGSLADLSLAIMKALWTRMETPAKIRPLILGLVTEDFALAGLSQGYPWPSLSFLSQNGVRGEELAEWSGAFESLACFSEDFDRRNREFASLAADPEFEKRLADRGYTPLFVSPGHLVEVLTAGALATASMASIANLTGEVGQVDFVVHKNHLSFLSGLVYASSLQLPVGLVYVGENEPAPLTGLFKAGRYAVPKKKRRRDDEGASWPVNLERLLFEVTGRDGDRVKAIIEEAEESDHRLLTEEETSLLNQSILVSGNDYKRCLRIIRSFYDQTDYLLARETADALGAWSRQSGQKQEGRVCFVQERSPLTDYRTCNRALFGDKASRQVREEAIRDLAHEAGLAVWQSFEEKEAGRPWDLEGPLDLAIFEWLDRKEERDVWEE